MTNPQSGVAERPPGILDSLRTFCASGHHEFWPDDLSLRDVAFDLSFAQGHRQLTDIYLLGLAAKMGGVLATFDRSSPLKAVRNARADTLAVIESLAG